MQKRQEVLKRLTARSLGKISSGGLRRLYRSVGSPLPEPPLSKAHGVLQLSSQSVERSLAGGRRETRTASPRYTCETESCSLSYRMPHPECRQRTDMPRDPAGIMASCDSRSDVRVIGRPNGAIITRPPHSKLGWMTPRAYARSIGQRG